MQIRTMFTRWFQYDSSPSQHNPIRPMPPRKNVVPLNRATECTRPISRARGVIDSPDVNGASVPFTETGLDQTGVHTFHFGVPSMPCYFALCHGTPHKGLPTLSRGKTYTRTLRHGHSQANNEASMSGRCPGCVVRSRFIGISRCATSELLCIDKEIQPHVTPAQSGRNLRWPASSSSLLLSCFQFYRLRGTGFFSASKLRATRTQTPLRPFRLTCYSSGGESADNLYTRFVLLLLPRARSNSPQE